MLARQLDLCLTGILGVGNRIEKPEATIRVGNHIEKTEATIPYAYTLEVSDKYPFKSNREPIYPQPVVCIGDHRQETYEILQTTRVRPTQAFISIEASFGAWNKVDS